MFMSLNARAIGLDLLARETIALAAAAGFGGVDLLVRDLVDAGTELEPLRALMNDLGLRGGAFPLPVNWRGSADDFARDLSRLPRYAAAAAELGLVRTGTWVMPETPHSRAETMAIHVERLGAIARVLRAEGVRLGLEVVGVARSRSGRGQPFVHRLTDLDRVFASLFHETPNLGVLVDSFHLFAAGEPIEAALAWGVGRVVWVHVADLPASAAAERATMIDQDRGLPGEHGAVESRSLLQALTTGGYDGPVTAEPMAGCRSLAGLSPEQAVHRVAAALRSVWPEASPAGNRGKESSRVVN
jgi:sugar phosphate isomerase/epimerase